jgi:RND family efflux transporter MFP subunit
VPPAARRREAVERLPRLEVKAPDRSEVVRRLDLSATVEPLKRVELSARVPGVVDYLPDDIDIGRRVKKDDVLLRLAVPELEAEKKHKSALLEQARKQKVQADEALAVAQAELKETQREEKRYQADLAYYKLRHARIDKLVKQRAQDPAMEEEARRQVQAADAALATFRAKVLTRQAKVRAATADRAVAERRIEVAETEEKRVEELVRFATVKAPFDGVITRRYVDPGAIIKDPGALLLTVMQIDKVRVLIDVPQRDVPLINTTEQNPNANGKGDPVVVRIPALMDQVRELERQLQKKGPSANDKADQRVKDGAFIGSITRMASALDPTTRTMRAEVELDNPRLPNRPGARQLPFLLSPGMYGIASVVVEQRSNVLTVPATALVRRGEGKVEVYVVADPVEVPEARGEERRGLLRPTTVELGIDDGKVAEIKGGLKGDELVVQRGNGVLRPNERVIAVPAK